MEIKLKEGVYNKILKALKQNANVDDIVKIQNDQYSFTCTICGGISMSFDLRTNADILIIKTTAKVDSNETVDLQELGAEIVEETNIIYTAYDDTIVFQLVSPLTVDGVEGQKQIFNEALGFVHLMCKYKDRLGCNAVSASAVDMDFTNDTDDDPYGFNDFSDDEEDENNNYQKVVELESNGDSFDVFDTEDIFDNPIQTEEVGVKLDVEKETKEEQSSAMDIDFFNGDFTQPIQNNESMEEEGTEDAFTPMMNDELFTENSKNTSASEKVNEDDEISAKLKELEEKRKQREKRRAERKAERNKKQQIETNNAQKVSNDDIINPTKSDNVDKKEEKNVNKSKQTKNETDNSEGLDMMFSFLTDDAVESSATVKQKDNKKEQSTPQQKSIEVSKKGNSNNSVERQNKKNKGNKGDNIKEEKTLSNKEANVVAPINYERAPEVVEQMKHLYAEIDQIFAQRKKQADYRETTLNEFSDRLDKREKELSVRSDRLEASYKEKQEELEKRRTDFETQKHEIDFQWEKLHMEQEMIESQKKDLEESKNLFEKTKKLDENKGSSDEQISMLNDEISEKDKEIESLKEKLSENEKESQEQIKSLNEKLSNFQSSMNSMISDDEVQELYAKIDELNEEIEDLNDDVEDLTDETEEKNQIIKTLQDKQLAMKEKELAWNEKESAYKTQLAKASDDMKKAIKNARNSVDMSQVKDLQDELDMANIRLKELETENNKLKNSSTDDATVAKLNQEISQLKSDLSKADEAYETERKAKEQALAERDIAKDSNKLAINIKDSLADIGIQVEPVATNGELILSGYSDSAQIVVNVDAGVLYIEKPVKKGLKYKANFEKWNQEDIRTSYLIYDKKIVCKSMYDDISKSTMDIIGRFSSLD